MALFQVPHKSNYSNLAQEEGTCHGLDVVCPPWDHVLVPRVGVMLRGDGPFKRWGLVGGPWVTGGVPSIEINIVFMEPFQLSGFLS